MLEDLGKVVETAGVLLGRGWLAAIGAVAPFVALAVFLAGTVGAGVVFAVLSLLAAFGAALAAFTLALEGRPRVRDVLVCILRRETLHVFWALPAATVFTSVVVVCLASALREPMPIVAWLLMGTPLVGMFVTVAALLGGVLLVTVSSYANRGPDPGPSVHDLVIPAPVLLPLSTVLPSIFVMTAVAGGWWNQGVVESAHRLLEVATGVGVFVAVVLLALLPPALYGVLRGPRAAA